MIHFKFFFRLRFFNPFISFLNNFRIFSFFVLCTAQIPTWNKYVGGCLNVSAVIGVSITKYHRRKFQDSEEKAKQVEGEKLELMQPEHASTTTTVQPEHASTTSTVKQEHVSTTSTMQPSPMKHPIPESNGKADFCMYGRSVFKRQSVGLYKAIDFAAFSGRTLHHYFCPSDLLYIQTCFS